MNIPSAISAAAVDAAHNMVDVCIQHAAFLAGRQEIETEIQAMLQGKGMCVYNYYHNHVRTIV